MWVKHRQITRKEDIAYSLLGILGVQMPLLYGEGKTTAMNRLLEGIIKNTEDYSILLWLNEEVAPLQPHRPTSGLNPDGSSPKESRLRWDALTFHSPVDIKSIEPHCRHISPLDPVPEPLQVSSRGLRVNLYTKRVGPSLIAWTYCTEVRNGLYYLVCLRVLSEDTVTEAHRTYARGTLTGDICHVSVSRLRGFALSVIYFPVSGFWAL